MSGFDILGLDHVVLRVRDLARAKRFYCEALGCRVERHQERLGLLQLRAGRSLIDLVDVDGVLGRAGGAPAAAAARNMDHFALRIDPFDETALTAQLQRYGVAIGEIAQRYGAEGEGPSLYIQDPDGNTVELKGPPRSASAPSTP